MAERKKYHEHFTKIGEGKSLLVGTGIAVEWHEEEAVFFDFETYEYLFTLPIAEIKKILGKTREEILLLYQEEDYFSDCPHCGHEQEMTRGKNVCAKCKKEFFVYRNEDTLEFFDSCPFEQQQEPRAQHREEEKIVEIIQKQSLHDATLALIEYATRFQNDEEAWRSIFHFVSSMVKG